MMAFGFLNYLQMSGGVSDGSFDADDLSEIRERFKEVKFLFVS